MAYFPQINGNMILTQLPYSAQLAYETIVQDMESGPRFSFPRRAASLTGHPTTPLGRFNVSFPNITDAEVEDLQTFFRARKGRLEAFSFLDPGGNLLEYSQDFSQSYWDKSNGPVTVGASVVDPFGGSIAKQLSAGGGDSYILGRIGPVDPNLSGFRMCASAWVNARDVGVSMFIGFQNSAGTKFGTEHALPFERWVRISHSFTLDDDNTWKFVLGGNSTWTSGRQVYVFCAQVSPMKGEGAEVSTPGNYGYHANCRFDVDVFERRCLGPNQNSVLLPIVEVNE